MNDVRPKKQLARQKLMTLLVALTCVSLLAAGFAYAKKTVHIVADGNVFDIKTLHSNPADILEQAGIHLDTKDEYRLSTEKVMNGATIEVFRAIPLFIAYQDKRDVIISGKPTVGEVIASLGISAADVKLVPGPETRTSSGLTIRVIAVKETLVEKEEVIPQPVVRQSDPTIEAGLEQVQQEGQDGMKKVTYRVRHEDGEQVAAEVVTEQVLKPAVPTLIRAGSRETVSTSRGTMRFRRVMQMEATAYLPTDGSGHGITYSGIPARHGIVAVDPRVIPLGTRVFVPGYGLALAADTGGDIKGNRIDLCMEESHAAWDFGRRMVKVYILAD